VTRSSTPDLLAAILAATRKVVESRRAREPLPALAARATARPPRGDVFHAAVATPGRVNIIAECKRRSPSRGVLRQAYTPDTIARGYQAAGAAAISVVTEPAFFDGSLDHLESVRAAVSIPVLRKDFVVDEYQLFEAVACGADAVLLIVSALTDGALVALQARAESLGLAVLVEVHDAPELDRALGAGARIIGVNNRDLRTLNVDVRASDDLAARIPSDVVAVSESGLTATADIARLRALGYRAFLIGERFMTAADPAAALAEFIA
jgi:indole-3-glycerol phosphate synthase